MDLEYAFLAKHADVSGGAGFSVIGGGVDHAAGPQLPIVVPVLCLVARFRFAPAECGQLHVVRLELRDPDGDLVPLMNTELPVKPDAPIMPDMAVSTLALLGMLNATFLKAGDYRFRFFLGERDLGGTSIRIQVTAPAVPAAPEYPEGAR
jgi:hypothetical protein